MNILDIITLDIMIGPASAAVFRTSLAGHRIYLPKRITPDHWLAQRIGHDAAMKICQAYGGEQFYVPTMRQQKRHARDQEIRHAFQQNPSVVALVRQYGLNRSTIRRIVRAPVPLP